MNRLRRLPTSRLLALCAAVLAIGIGAAAIATAALGGSGQVPPPKPLAVAIRDALRAPRVEGVTARVAFTNHLVDGAGLQGSDPLLSGATGRLWLSRDGGVRIELQSRGGDAQVVSDGRAFSAYDAASNTAYRGRLPAPERARPERERGGGPPPLRRVEQALQRVMTRVDLAGPAPGSIAGRPAYTVRLAPRRSGGLLGGAAVAWDAVRGVPLRLAMYARGRPAPVLELAATDISYGPVPASVFHVAPPAGAKVTDLGTLARPRERGRRSRERGPTDLRALRALRAALPFPLSAPAKLAGLPRHGTRALGGARPEGAVLAYGSGPGGVLVVERRIDARSAPTPAPPAPSRDGGPRLTLPRVAIGGAPGTELATPLGTVVRFERGGVAYTVIGSVPKAVAEAAARGL